VDLDLPLQDPEHPIPDLNVVDVNVVKASGGSDLRLVVASPLGEDEYSLSRLLRKIETYLDFTNSAEFVAESGLATPSNTRIVVKLHPESSAFAVELIHRNVQWALNNGVTLVVERLDEHSPLQ
jgi:hypothetical protein